MEIQCECGKFKAELKNFPRETPGRVGCYCDDCQAYLHHLGKTQHMDKSGCTEVIPVYPQNFVVKEGGQFLKCLRLSDKGAFRWYAECCNSPIANTKDGTPWLGIFAHVFKYKNPKYLDETLGPVKARIMGKFASGPTEPGTPDQFNFKGMRTVMPFLLKGKLFKKHRGSPFFKEDGRTPVSPPTVLSSAEREALRAKMSVPN